MPQRKKYLPGHADNCLKIRNRDLQLLEPMMDILDEGYGYTSGRPQMMYNVDQYGRSVYDREQDSLNLYTESPTLTMPSTEEQYAHHRSQKRQMEPREDPWEMDEKRCAPPAIPSHGRPSIFRTTERNLIYGTTTWEV